MYSLDDFDYILPQELIALTPANQRECSRLLVVKQQDEPLLQDLNFSDIISYINPGDLVVFNDSKVMKARLYGNKATGGKIELLIERIIDEWYLLAHVKSNKHIPDGMAIQLPELNLNVIQNLNGIFKLKATTKTNWLDYLQKHGEIPIPPYLKREAQELDLARYQTVYAKINGSVAAPTAGLHFTYELIEQIKAKGANIAFVTLHVGSGTFKSVTTQNIYEHKMHSEIYQVDQKVVDLIKQTKARNNKIFAVGTTSTRVLESIALNNYTQLIGETNIFITPGFKFKLVDYLITNFHLPKSTLLMLVSAFAGFDTIKQAYALAIAKQYKFFSYGDAMLLSKKE